MNILSQINIGITPPSNAIQPEGNGGVTLANIISTTIGAMTIIAAIWFMFKIITGGMAIINSNGDPKAVADARGQITNGIIGMIVIITATMLVGLLGYILGVDNILDIAGFLG